MNPSTNCPHCGDQQWYTFSNGHNAYKCWSTTEKQSELCREREARQKAEAQNRRLHEQVQELNENAENITTYADRLLKSQYENQKLAELCEEILQKIEQDVWIENQEAVDLFREKLAQLTK